MSGTPASPGTPPLDPGVTTYGASPEGPSGLPPVSTGMSETPAATMTAPPPPPRRKTLLVVVVAVVAVVVVLGALFALGVFSSSGGGGGGAGVVEPATYYGQNNRSADSVAGNASDGPWTVRAVLGINIGASVSSPNEGQFGGGPGCTYAAAPGAPTTFVLPATAAGAAAGSAASWVFLASNPSNQVLLIQSVNGTATAMVIGTGNCFTDFEDFASLSAVDAVNSSVIAIAAFAGGGSAFLSAHAGASVIYLLAGPSSGVGSSGIWALEIDTCGFSATGGTGTLWIQLFDAETGASITSASTESESC